MMNRTIFLILFAVLQFCWIIINQKALVRKKNMGRTESLCLSFSFLRRIDKKCESSAIYPRLAGYFK